MSLFACFFLFTYRGESQAEIRDISSLKEVDSYQKGVYFDLSKKQESKE
jgi:hypothetical protein